MEGEEERHEVSSAAKICFDYIGKYKFIMDLDLVEWRDPHHDERKSVLVQASQT